MLLAVVPVRVFAGAGAAAASVSVSIEEDSTLAAVSIGSGGKNVCCTVIPPTNMITERTINNMVLRSILTPHNVRGHRKIWMEGRK